MKKTKKCLIKIDNENIQNKVKSKYGVKVPLNKVFDTETGMINSPLYFDMWEPYKEYNYE